MIIYEVNLKVEPEIESDYLLWLKAHMQEMLNLPGFLSSRLYLESSRFSTNDDIIYTARYEIASMEALDNYLDKYAPKMRQDGIDKFDAKFTATRKVLEFCENFQANKTR